MNNTTVKVNITNPEAKTKYLRQSINRVTEGILDNQKLNIIMQRLFPASVRYDVRVINKEEYLELSKNITGEMIPTVSRFMSTIKPIIDENDSELFGDLRIIHKRDFVKPISDNLSSRDTVHSVLIYEPKLSVKPKSINHFRL
jgi:predicted regulator of amino acid metabolism with ACT domain